MYAIIIRFLCRAVTVKTDSADVIALLARRFNKMVVADCPDSGTEINVTRQGDGFFLDLANTVYPPSALQQSLEYHILDRLIQASPEFLWLHAGAVARDGRALLVAGSSGCGKSTLVLGLCERGWGYLSDDILPVHMECRRIYPFLRTPWFRLENGVELPPDQIYQLDKREIELNESFTQKSPAALAVLVFPSYRHGASLSVERFLPGASIALELATQTMNFSAHGPAALTFLSDIVRRIPAYRISYSKPREVISLVEELWDRHVSTE